MWQKGCVLYFHSPLVQALYHLDPTLLKRCRLITRHTHTQESCLHSPQKSTVIPTFPSIARGTKLLHKSGLQLPTQSPHIVLLYTSLLHSLTTPIIQTVTLPHQLPSQSSTFHTHPASNSTLLPLSTQHPQPLRQQQAREFASTAAPPTRC